MSNCFENLFKPVAQAFQPVSRKQVSRAQPGTAGCNFAPTTETVHTFRLS